MKSPSIWYTLESLDEAQVSSVLVDSSQDRLGSLGESSSWNFMGAKEHRPEATPRLDNNPGRTLGFGSGVSFLNGSALHRAAFRSSVKSSLRGMEVQKVTLLVLLSPSPSSATFNATMGTS